MVSGPHTRVWTRLMCTVQRVELNVQFPRKPVDVTTCLPIKKQHSLVEGGQERRIPPAGRTVYFLGEASLSSEVPPFRHESS